MTLEELEKKLKELDDLRSELNKLDDLRMELNKHIAELKERDDEKPKPPHLRPYLEDDQNYFFINAMGKIEKSKWMSDRFDLGAREIGNIFMGETAAEFYAERLTVLAEMREWAGNWDDGVALKYDGTNKLISAIFIAPRQYTFGDMRFATKEDAENCIMAVGEERLKKYYFMIPEEETNND